MCDPSAIVTSYVTSAVTCGKTQSEKPACSNRVSDGDDASAVSSAGLGSKTSANPGNENNESNGSSTEKSAGKEAVTNRCDGGCVDPVVDPVSGTKPGKGERPHAGNTTNPSDERRERKRKVNRLSAQRKRTRERELLDSLSMQFESLSSVNEKLKKESAELRGVLEVIRRSRLQSELQQQPVEQCGTHSSRTGITMPGKLVQEQRQTTLFRPYERTQTNQAEQQVKSALAILQQHVAASQQIPVINSNNSEDQIRALLRQCQGLHVKDQAASLSNFGQAARATASAAPNASDQVLQKLLLQVALKQQQESVHQKQLQQAVTAIYQGSGGQQQTPQQDAGLSLYPNECVPTSATSSNQILPQLMIALARQQHNQQNQRQSEMVESLHQILSPLQQHATATEFVPPPLDRVVEQLQSIIVSLSSPKQRPATENGRSC